LAAELEQFERPLLKVDVYDLLLGALEVIR
jgi:hypothetical protein